MACADPTVRSRQVTATMSHDSHMTHSLVDCKCLLQVLEHDAVLHGDGEVLNVAWAKRPAVEGSHDSHMT